MAIPYNLNIPDAPNNPSDDQPKMQENTNSIDSLVAIDHYTFADATAGQHKQITLAGKNAAGAQTDPVSVIYSGSGTASTVAQLNYRNQNGIFPLSCVRAWAYSTGGAVPVFTQNVNVSTIARTAAGKYTVTLTANAVSSNSFAVIPSAYGTGTALGNNVIYNITGTGTFELVFPVLNGASLADPTNFSFMVLQI